MLIKGYKTALQDLLAGYEQVCYVADRKVYDIAGLSLHPCLLVDCSEESKTIETACRIWDFFLEQGMTRRGVVVCIGGGVLTDTAGFAAATYKRGMDYITVPTTLLAMIDASSGGKTGINYHGLKNAVGAFAPPVQTLICPGWLSSLPTEQLLSGYAEMLKTALIAPTSDLWPRLLQYDLERMDIETLTPLIADCVAVKEQIVAADPKEEGLRKVLNFGHTFGHALEEIQMVHGTSSNGKWLHGYAVLYGMIAELYLSVTKLGCPKEPLQQLTQLMLHYYGKPNCKCSDRERLIALMQQDKKNERAVEINCTLLQTIGSPVINQIITPDEANEALDYLFSL
jgi:3-dehydroquinate synthase